MAGSKRPATAPTNAPAASTRSIPRLALALGVLGTAPFALAAGAVLWAPQPWPLFAFSALIGYGTCVLSFLGAVHWGLAMRDPAPRPSQFLIGAAAPLTAWLSLAFGSAVAVLGLATGFLAMLAYDIAAARRGAAPAWYPRLRWPLTGIALLCLVTPAAAGVR
ncbi:MAG: DUF3429 domain-containing protein [Rhodospirillales bacterium]|nr:MAG: DUF3429 domain-containing protein [Rhodospirillales bacterium]